MHKAMPAFGQALTLLALALPSLARLDNDLEAPPHGDVVAVLASADDECDGEVCALSLLSLRARQKKTTECPCPPGFYRCLAGNAAGGCFPNPTSASADCVELEAEPCNGPGDTGSVAGVPRSPPTTPPPLTTTSNPEPVYGGTQETRLRVTNGCQDESIWIAHMAGATDGPHPQNIRLPPNASHDFDIPDGLAATRYWPKLGCNARGEECNLGESGGPGQTCKAGVGCAPPVDSKFEATFGVVGEPCAPGMGKIKGCDWLDISLVDGFTVPFKVDVIGDCHGNRGVDCSSLRLSECPEDLRVVDLFSQEVAGCYSPCAKKTYRQWGNEDGAHAPSDEAAKMLCCPTPPVSPEQCSAGPVASSEYVQMVHQRCPGVYGYAYDDAVGLSLCPAGVQYEVTFYCPSP